MTWLNTPLEQVSRARTCSIGRLRAAWSQALSGQNDKFPGCGVVLQRQASGGEPFHEGVDRYLAINQGRQVDRLFQGCRGGTRPPGEDLGAQDA